MPTRLRRFGIRGARRQPAGADRGAAYQRPNMIELAQELGYSSRTIDRACRQVTGRTAKQVLDERVAFEVVGC